MKKLLAICILSFCLMECHSPQSDGINPSFANQSPGSISQKSTKEQIAYTQFHLQAVAEGILSATDKSSVRQFVYEQIEKQQWQEYSVLISTLIRNYKPSKPIGSMAKSAPSPSHSSGLFSGYGLFSEIDAPEKVSQSLMAFAGINGKILFPQIYIPFYDQVKLRNKDIVVNDIGARNGIGARTESKEKPVIIFYAGDESQSAYPGFLQNDKGKLVKTSLMVDEQYAKQHEVWIFSLSESAEVNLEKTQMQAAIECPVMQVASTTSSTNSTSSSTQQVCFPIDPQPPFPIPTPLPRYCLSDGNPSNSNPRASAKGIDVSIAKMQVKCHKESWAAGASEVKGIITTVWNTGYDPFTNQQDLVLIAGYKLVWYPTNTGGQINVMQKTNFIDIDMGKIARSSVNNQTVLNINKKILWSWGGKVDQVTGTVVTKVNDPRKDNLILLAYEFDQWPGGSRRPARISTQGGKNPLGTTSNQTIEIWYYSSDDYYAIMEGNWYQGSINYVCGDNITTGCMYLNLATGVGTEQPYEM